MTREQIIAEADKRFTEWDKADESQSGAIYHGFIEGALWNNTESCCVRLEHTFWQMTEDQRVRYGLPFTGISWWRCTRCGKFVQSM